MTLLIVAVDILPLLSVCLHGVFTARHLEGGEGGKGNAVELLAIKLSYLVLSSLPSPGLGRYKPSLREPVDEAGCDARERSTLQIRKCGRSRPNCLLVIRSVPILIQNEVCCVGVACTLHMFSDIASNTMAVKPVIKELRWLAAAGECGRAATSYILVTSDKSVRLTVYETGLYERALVCVLY